MRQRAGGAPEAVPDFVHFSQEWANFIHAHHESEETMFFPRLEEFAGAKGIRGDWHKWSKDVAAEVLAKTEAVAKVGRRTVLRGYLPMPTTGQYTTVPFALHVHDKTFDKGVFAWWPPIPWFGMLILRWFFVPRHEAWWASGPCDASGNPRDMPFAD